MMTFAFSALSLSMLMPATLRTACSIGSSSLGGSSGSGDLGSSRPRRSRLAVMSTTSFDPSIYFTKPRDDDTKQYIMQQTMLRVKDPQKSLSFYCDTLGFNLLMYREFPQWGFNVYFVAQADPATIPTDRDEQWRYCMRTAGCIELTWNYGSENADGKVYNTGNGDATGTDDGNPIKGGFGHLGITVPDVYDACERFKAMGAEFHKSPNSGGMKGLAFVKDPDGYLIEILPQGEMITKPLDCDGVALEGGEGYTDNSKA
jgi:lactoylglutathione lyase|tara:strand:+ start:167 stop:943 length:777 start_codon:yes stop_codon:yes gene_type:complete